MTLAREPRTSPIVPSYGESSLADLSASILASLTGDAGANVLGLPETSRVCLLLVDGLGLELLRGHQAAAPFLAELAFNSRPLTAGAPSTTVTASPRSVPDWRRRYTGCLATRSRSLARAVCSTACTGPRTSI